MAWEGTGECERMQEDAGGAGWEGAGRCRKVLKDPKVMTAYFTVINFLDN